MLTLTVFLFLISLVFGYTFIFCSSAQTPSASPTLSEISHVQYSYWYPNGSMMPNPQVNLPISVAEAPKSGNYSFKVCIKNDGNVPINVGYAGFQNVNLPAGVSIMMGGAQYFGMGIPVEAGQNYTGSLSIWLSVANGTYTPGASFSYSFDLVFGATNANDRTASTVFLQAIHITGLATYPSQQATPTPTAATLTPSPAATLTPQQSDAAQSSMSTANPAASNNPSQNSLATDPSQTTVQASAAPKEAIPELPTVGLITVFMALISACAFAYTLKRKQHAKISFL